MSFFKSFDWITAIIYVILVLCGWATIHAASSDFGSLSIFDFQSHSGKQMVWFGLSLFLIIVILCIDSKTYMTYAPVIYIVMMLILVATIFLAPDIKGSRSWLRFGTFQIQPAEFGKFSTALMLGWLFNTYNFKFTEIKNFLKACLIALLPVILIILQKETGSALVYFSLIFLFYRMGMSGVVLWCGFCSVLIFVLSVKYGVDVATGDPSDLGRNLVLLLVPYLCSAMLAFFADNKQAAFKLILYSTGVYSLFEIFNHFVPHEFTFRFWWFGLGMSIFSILYTIWLWLINKKNNYLFVAAFTSFFIILMYSVDYAFNNILEDHQRTRIEVLLGIKEDAKGVGYNVIQAEIAIGSGGFTGKGYLEGTQTKLAYVPEQETDFIFCTVGEEQGFIGTSLLVFLYGFLVVRLIMLAERQRTTFALVYGYCVASIFAFHVMINVGMVIGLVPVIGIPLPFFSYGGSGLWSFTILLFIFLKLDASRIERY